MTRPGVSCTAVAIQNSSEWPCSMCPFLQLRLVGVRTSYIYFSNISWTSWVLDPITNPYLGSPSWLYPVILWSEQTLGTIFMNWAWQKWCHRTSETRAKKASSAPTFGTFTLGTQPPCYEKAQVTWRSTRGEKPKLPTEHPGRQLAPAPQPRECAILETDPPALS